MLAGYNLAPLLLSRQKDAAVVRLAVGKQGDATELSMSRRSGSYTDRQLTNHKLCLQFQLTAGHLQRGDERAGSLQDRVSVPAVRRS